MFIFVRIRQFGTLEKIFDFFSTYQYVDGKGRLAFLRKPPSAVPLLRRNALFSPAGRKTTLMSVKDFYNSITPGSTLTHGTGRGVYTRVEDQEIGSQKLYEQEHVPVRDSILNKVLK